MNTNPLAKRVLCYGDSNTWGRSGKNIDRYPVDVRWTGLLQDMLGEDFEIIEEGLRSRTTNLDDDDPIFPGRNGLEYFRPCLESHGPLDIVILWLGTNDLKSKFNRDANKIASAMMELISEVRDSKIILVAPPFVKENILKSETQFKGAGKKSQMLGEELRKLAIEKNCSFIDLGPVVEVGDFDGVHLESESQPVVAEIIYKEIKKL
jgi:lysophospholipase L1-like esterase